MYFNSIDPLVYQWRQKYKRILYNSGDLNQYGNYSLTFDIFIEDFFEFEYSLLGFHSPQLDKCMKILINAPDNVFLSLMSYFGTELKHLDPFHIKCSTNYLQSIAKKAKK
jgi:hypothetical protein